jgi:hypothetical protein
VGRLVRHRASLRLGQPSRPEEIEADLDLLDASVAIEAWWWTGDLAADYGVEAWLDRSARQVTRLSQQAGPRYASGLRHAAHQRFAAWRSHIGQRPAG